MPSYPQPQQLHPPHPPHPPPPPRPSPIGPMLVGAALLTAGCGGGLLAGWFAGTANAFFSDASEITGELFRLDEGVLEPLISAPTSARVGEAFDLVVDVRNPGPGPVVLDTLDFEFDGWLAFEILEITPQPNGRHVIDTDYIEFDYGVEIPPGAAHAVTFRLRPTTPGTHGWDVNAYTASGALDFKSISIDVEPGGTDRPKRPAF